MKNIRTLFPIKIAIASFAMYLGSGCTSESGVVITFDAYINDQQLEYGKKYPAPNGDGMFALTDFMFYISNIRLVRSNGDDYAEGDSYHLIKFRDGKGHSLVLDNVDIGLYDHLAFSIGIDSAANLSAVPRGDLDPTNQMAWNWTAGYKFVLLEGKYYPESGRSVPLVYHIGFSENKKDVMIRLPKAGPIRLKVEIDKFFTSPNAIDFHTYPEVLFNEEHAAMVAANYADGFVTIP